jgi:hypothetical protein
MERVTDNGAIHPERLEKRHDRRIVLQLDESVVPALVEHFPTSYSRSQIGRQRGDFWGHLLATERLHLPDKPAEVRLMYPWSYSLHFAGK